MTEAEWAQPSGYMWSVKHGCSSWICAVLAATIQLRTLSSEISQFQLSQSVSQ